jgi:hypothetical protein
MQLQTFCPQNLYVKKGETAKLTAKNTFSFLLSNNEPIRNLSDYII